jgi:DNA polymerase-3 subunit chi
MTERVDFYVLPSASPKQRWTFACRLTEKAYLRDLRIVILSDSLADAQALDDLLWTFNDRSFIPHQLCVDERTPDPSTRVQLSAAPGPSPSADLLVNLAARLPDQWERYTRIVEIIDADEERRRLGRERFKAYRDLKIPLETHPAAQEDPNRHG